MADVKCFKADDHAPDQPCWGDIGFIWDGQPGGDEYRIPTCEGHRPMYDDEPYIHQPSTDAQP